MANMNISSSPSDASLIADFHLRNAFLMENLLWPNGLSLPSLNTPIHASSNTIAENTVQAPKVCSSDATVITSTNPSSVSFSNRALLTDQFRSYTPSLNPLACMPFANSLGLFNSDENGRQAKAFASTTNAIPLTSNPSTLPGSTNISVPSPSALLNAFFDFAQPQDLPSDVRWMHQLRHKMHFPTSGALTFPTLGLAPLNTMTQSIAPITSASTSRSSAFSSAAAFSIERLLANSAQKTDSISTSISRSAQRSNVQNGDTKIDPTGELEEETEEIHTDMTGLSRPISRASSSSHSAQLSTSTVLNPLTCESGETTDNSVLMTTFYPGLDYTWICPSKQLQRKRTVFTLYQRTKLEETFLKKKYISKSDRILLAKKIGLNDSQIKVWFINRRTKWRNDKERLEMKKKSASKFNSS